MAAPVIGEMQQNPTGQNNAGPPPPQTLDASVKYQVDQPPVYGMPAGSAQVQVNGMSPQWAPQSPPVQFPSNGTPQVVQMPLQYPINGMSQGPYIVSTQPNQFPNQQVFYNMNPTGQTYPPGVVVMQQPGIPNQPKVGQVSPPGGWALGVSCDHEYRNNFYSSAVSAHTFKSIKFLIILKSFLG